MAISHNSIPNNIRTPLAFIEFDNTGAVSGTPAPLHQVLMISLSNEDGKAPTDEVVRIQNPNAAMEAFGYGSMGHFMAKTFFDNNKEGNVFALALKEVGTAAKGSIEIIGNATHGGTVALYIAGIRVQIVIPRGATTAKMHELTAEAINAALLPVTAEVVTEKVELTARWKGETGNETSILVNYHGESMPQGIDLQITGMAKGSGSPDISSALVALGQDWYQHIIMPFTDAVSLDALRDELMERWGPMQQIDGMAYIAKSGTFGELSAFGLKRNDHVLSCLGLYGSPTPSYQIAAAYGAVTSKYIAIDPARPLQTLVLKSVVAPKVMDGFERNERNLLLHEGISTTTVNAGNEVQLERAITMYRTNNLGANDPSYLDVMTPHTLSHWRYAVRTRMMLKYPRHKLADDDANISPGQAVVKPKTIRAELIALYGELEWQGLFENVDAFAESLIVERNENDRNRIDVLSQPDLVNQFMIYAETTQFVL
ncbi:phage tail sheath subtilisin-like domain-containing protein [Ignatzschineria cameli]|uniref:Phage tail protein n=1 Tax=Ignatzschineria cameli TaxID=2182793 RepID=A0ABX5L168_9GAMM|nr:phage tail sheath subtilisin-like domain-containing protein [Ignatzschineria cameli]PWD90343.1 phage tail protein [Ignatzschineria cameli]PWD92226.1 phage tail protein [Ignatzschineria cameli]PWD93020.1 phage tail protein [Ignatzschineria cameli]